MGIYTNTVQKMYVAFFNRPADALGQAFWESQMANGTTEAQIAAAFAGSAEYKALYAGMDTATTVANLYTNLFGRTAAANEVIFWGTRMLQGLETVDSIARTLANSAQGTDATAIANKIAAANAFTTALDTTAEITGYSGLAANASARTWLATVTDSAASLTAATGSVNTAITSATAAAATAAGQTFTLTAGVDTVTGGTGNDTINAPYDLTNAVSTLNGLDSIDGGAGTDTLNVTDSAGGKINVSLPASVKNVETANFTSVTELGNSGAADVSGWTGLTTANFTLNNVSANNQVITAAATTAVTVTATETAQKNLTINGGSTVTAALTTSGAITAGTMLASGTATSVSLKETIGAGGTAAAQNVTDTGVSATKAGTLTTVSLDGYGASSTITSNALTSLSLANSSSAATNVTITNSLTTPTNTTLALTVNNLTGATTLVDTNNEIKTLNITTAGGTTAAGVALDSTLAAITDSGLTALTVGGTNVLTLTSNAGIANLKTVAVTGSAGLAGDFSFASITGVDTSATTGKSTITVDATKATFTGGAGVDNVTTSAVAPTKAISLGAGDDSVTLASGTTAMGTGGTIDGGTGTDTLVMVAADAATASGSTTFATKVTGFEHLTLTTPSTSAIDVAQLGNYSYITHAEGAATALTLNNLASGGTIVLTGAGNAGSAVTANIANAATGTADVLNLVTSHTTSLNAGTVTAANVETINITASDTTANVTAGTSTDTLVLVATSAKTITVTGNANLTLTNTGNTAVTSIDASGMTGGLSVTTAGTVAETVKGGAAANSLIAAAGTTADTLIGGAAADTLTNNAGLDTLTGGAGADTFKIDTVGANVNTYTTITDAAKGDIISLKSMAAEALIGASMTLSKISLSGTAVFQDYANAVIAAGGDSSTNGHIGWFTFGGDTYVVESMHNGTATPSFVNGTDLVVKLTGVIDLSTATFASGAAAADATITLA